MKPIDTQADVAIREAEAADMPALMRLAELDSHPVPAGKLIVAEADGGIRAALEVGSDSVIADPFVPTAHLQDLLRLRADQIAHERPAHGLLAALHLRPGRAG